MSEEQQVASEASVDWKSSISEEYRDSVSNYNDINDLVKSHNEAQSFIGKSVRIPGEDASDEARQEFFQKLQQVDGVMKAPNLENPEEAAQFYNSLGRPESPEGYEFQMEYVSEKDAPFVEGFREIAHQAGLTKAQMDAVAEYYTNNSLSQAESQQAEYEQAMSSLKDKWGQDYDARVSGARAALDHYTKGNQELQAKIIEGVGNNTVILEMMSDLYKSLKESNSLSGEQKISYGTSPEDALEKIREIRNNSAHPAMDKRHPNHKAEHARLTKLYEIAYSGEH